MNNAARTDRARTDQARTSEPTQIGSRHRRSPGRRVIGFGVGIGVAAAAVAVALVITSAPQPSAKTGQPSAGAAAPTSAGAKPSSAPLRVNAQLMSLAAAIESNTDPLPGNASLVISKRTNSSVGGVEVFYDLFTDSGDLYSGLTKSGLLAEIAGHDGGAHGMYAREAAAARYAVNGDLATARVKLINATPNPFMLGYSPAQKKAFLKKLAVSNAQLRAEGIKVDGLSTGKALQENLDNYVWNNCLDVLDQAGGNLQLRAGVLRLLSTVPEVTVKSSTTDGKPTLTLTASPALWGGTENNVLTIAAKTGIPIRFTSSVPGQAAPSTVETYQVSRVTVADVAAGKF